MPGEVMSNMRDSHRLFLQSMLSRHILTASDIKKLYRQACERFEEDFTDDQLAHFVKTINHNIAPIHMEIKKGLSEETGANFYALVNTQESGITRCSPDYTPNDLELFKKIVEKIVESESGDVSSIEATNLCDELDKKVSKKEGDEIITRMVTDNWFRYNEGRLSLHTRSLIELEQYLKDQFPEQVVCCDMCKKVCLKGESCTHCEVKLHFHCSKRYFKDQSNPKCPARGCTKPWGHAANGVTAPPPSQPSTSGANISTQPQTRKRRR